MTNDNLVTGDLLLHIVDKIGVEIVQMFLKYPQCNKRSCSSSSSPQDPSYKLEKIMEQNIA
jgi:hypothetical protein